MELQTVTDWPLVHRCTEDSTGQCLFTITHFIDNNHGHVKWKWNCSQVMDNKSRRSNIKRHDDSIKRGHNERQTERRVCWLHQVLGQDQVYEYRYWLFFFFVSSFLVVDRAFCGCYWQAMGFAYRRRLSVPVLHVDLNSTPTTHHYADDDNSSSPTPTPSPVKCPFNGNQVIPLQQQIASADNK